MAPRSLFLFVFLKLPDLEDLMKRKNQKILTPLVSLDTPGKATVQVVILADPDGHEICFVGDEAFRELSKMDPKGSKLLDDVSLVSKFLSPWAQGGGVKCIWGRAKATGTSFYYQNHILLRSR